MRSVLFSALTLIATSLIGQSFNDFARYGVYGFNDFYGYRGSTGEITFPRAAFLIHELYSDSGLVIDGAQLKTLGIMEYNADGPELFDVQGLKIQQNYKVVVLSGTKKSKMFWNVQDVLGQNIRSKVLGEYGQIMAKELKGIVEACEEATESSPWAQYVADLQKAYNGKVITEKELLIFSSPVLLQIYRYVNDVKLNADLPRADVDVNFVQQYWSQLIFLIEVHPDPRVQREYGELLFFKDQLIQSTEVYSTGSLIDYLTSVGITDLTENQLAFFRAEVSDKNEYVLTKTASGALLRKPLKL